MRKMILTLTVVALVSGTTLAIAYTAFLPRIQHNQQVALERSLSALFEKGESPEFETLDAEGPTIYQATAGGELIGYAVRVVTTGYGGDIKLLVGIGPDLERITGMEVVEHAETPGLGGKIDGAPFKQQFEGLQPREDISYIKGGSAQKEENEIEAISGATISTKAVVNGINRTLENAVPILGEGSGKESGE
jgi:electron transport complex protein RnfG